MKKAVKRYFAFILFILVNLSAVFASSDKRYVTFDAGLSTAVPVYGDSKIRELNNDIQNKGFCLVTGVIGDINVYLNQYLTFFTGCDLIFDVRMTSPSSAESSYFNHLDLAFFPGIKYYPGLGGLNISCSYVTGYRIDFSKQNEKNGDPVYWGNGFRLGLEYNFSYGSKNYWPSVGLYYRLMPRGSYNYDNIFGFYVTFNF